MNDRLNNELAARKTKGGQMDKWQRLTPFEKGLVCYNAKNYEKSYHWFSRATEDNPENGPAWRYMGICLVMLGRFEESINVLNRAKDIDQGDLFALYYKAIAFSEMGNYSEGLRHLSELLELDKDYIDGWVTKGDIHFKLNEYIDAETCYRNAISIDPYNVNALNRLGNNLMHMGRQNDAQVFFDRAANAEKKQ